MPLALLLVGGLPSDRLESGSHFGIYLAVTIVFGLLISWCAAACNSPLFAEIVPPKKRSLVYAFDRCFEGALAACAAPVVGLLAEHIFGFDRAAIERRGGAAAGGSPADAAALGRSLIWCLCTPWAACFCIYFGLYKTYPVDRAKLKGGRSGPGGNSGGGGNAQHTEA